MPSDLNSFENGTMRNSVRVVLCVVLLVVLATVVQTGGKADDSKTTQPATARTSEPVNIMWRFDGNGRFPNIQPPGTWGAEENILWKTPVDIGGYSSPIVAGGRVFVTAEMGSLF